MTKKELLNSILKDEYVCLKILCKMLDKGAIKSCCAFFNPDESFLAKGDTPCKEIIYKSLKNLNKKEIMEVYNGNSL